MTPAAIVMERLSLRARLERLLAEGLEPDEAALEVIRRLRANELRELAAPLVEDLARQIARAATREVEHGLAAPFDPLEARQKLGPGHGFRLPDGRFVLWVEATAADHREVAAFHRKLAAGNIATAERHEAAAEAIEAAGVSCLAEISA